MSACCDNNIGAKRRVGWRRFLTPRIGVIAGLIAIAGGGLALGGWGWLIAVGFAPIILSLLPCLVMCGLGLCMMGMNRSKSTPVPVIDATIQNSDGATHRGEMMTPIAHR